MSIVPNERGSLKSIERVLREKERERDTDRESEPESSTLRKAALSTMPPRAKFKMWALLCRVTPDPTLSFTNTTHPGNKTLRVRSRFAYLHVEEKVVAEEVLCLSFDERDVDGDVVRELRDFPHTLHPLDLSSYFFGRETC